MVRYLGIEVDDAIEIAEKIDISHLISTQSLQFRPWSAALVASPTTIHPMSASGMFRQVGATTARRSDCL
jgi:hypothetical protein